MSTYMWQKERGVNIFRFQTNEKSVAEKMKRNLAERVFLKYIIVRII